jgi:uncharacterized membrane protein
MEIALLLVIIVLLFIKLRDLSANLDHLQMSLNDLKEFIKELSLQKNQEDVLTHDFKTERIAEPIITKPIEIKTVIEQKPLEKVPPIVEETIFEDKTEPVAEVSPAYYEEPKKSWWENFREQNPDLEKFVGENLISKIGVLILVLGISYFVKFAIDKNWINETARVGIGILCGAIVMGFAHKLRGNYKAFSSVLVAGAIAIFYFTIAIAFHQYHIFSQTVAFILMVIITAFSVLISVSYDRMELAILSLIGGFAVPFMLSTGEGNYQVLFSYITILNIGILATAYLKKWNLVNVLAFVFTAILFGGWQATKVVGMQNDTPGDVPYLGAFVFATIFYLIFTLINIINNLRTNGLFSKLELGILISNTALYFSAGMLIFANFHPELKGVFTISLALFNFICAWVLFKKYGLDKRAVYLLIGLTLTFVTLAIPIQFKGNYITLFWAAEAVLLLWLSQRSQMVQFRFVSIIVQFLMIWSLVLDWFNVYSSNTEIAPLLLNSCFIAGIFAAMSFVLTGFLSKKEVENHTFFGIVLNPVKYRNSVGVLALITFYITGFLEINYQSNQYFSNYSSSSLPVAYHLVFCAVLVFFLKKTESLFKQRFVIGLSLLNIVLYCLFFSNIPLAELQGNLSLDATSNIAFILHYVSLACIIYFGFVIWKDCNTSDAFLLSERKWFIWIAALGFVYIASNEVMLHGLAFLTEPVAIKNNESYSKAYQIYEKAQTLLTKVAFPILWGILAFVFLTIGIKNQWKNLRIVALTLLGITIAKLFVYDISNVSETGKIIAFILLGVLILVMSFAYQKIKTIVLNEDEKEKTTDENN